MKKKNKHTGLLAKIQMHVKADRFLSTVHANRRQVERDILIPDLLHVLLTGRHEASKDRYEEGYEAWNYAIRGNTVDDRDLRVIVSFDENMMLIITAFEIGR